MVSSRPQDLYPGMGDLVRSAADLADQIAVLRARCETWEPSELRVDAGSQWSADETLAAVLGDLAGAEEALRSAGGRIEGAWAAVGRLATD